MFMFYYVGLPMVTSGNVRDFLVTLRVVNQNNYLSVIQGHTQKAKNY